MAETLRQIWHALAAIAMGSTLSNLVLGGVLLLLKTWVPTEPDLRKSVNLLRERLREKVNKQLYMLISTAVKDLNPETLRAATPAKPDLIADYTTEALRVSGILYKLDRIENAVSLAHTLLLCSVCVAIVSVLGVFAVPMLRPVFTLVSILTIIFQLGVVFFVRKHLAALSNYELTC